MDLIFKNNMNPMEYKIVNTVSITRNQMNMKI